MKARFLLKFVATLLIGPVGISSAHALYEEQSHMDRSSRRLLYGDQNPTEAPWRALHFAQKQFGTCSVADAWVEPRQETIYRSFAGVKLQNKTVSRTLVFVLLNVPDASAGRPRLHLYNKMGAAGQFVRIDGDLFWLYSAAVAQTNALSLTFDCGTSASTTATTTD